MTHITHLEELQTRYSGAILATYLVGSRAYGTATAESDTDYRGVFVLPMRAYVSIREPVAQVSDERNNTTYYTLKRFFELAATANPNIIEMLFIPDDCVVFESPLMKRLLQSRDMFITKQAYSSHVHYAMSQIKRAKGQNKWINNPQPEILPSEEDFCWLIPMNQSPQRKQETRNKSRNGAQRNDGMHDNFPLRPVPIKQTGMDLSECHCAAVEHLANAYRLYHYGKSARGVFRGGLIVCESIPKDDEQTKCVGMLIYNRAEHERAVRDHGHYWNWRQHRNETRWQSQERGERDYDAKNMMHTFRLLLSGENILRHGEPLVRFEGEPLQLLRDIRDGRFAYDDLIRMADERFAAFSASLQTSNLPEAVEPERIDTLLHEITEEWEAEHGW